jgi:hypothetical protein
MFRGQEGPGNSARKAEMAKYPKGIHVIFNLKAYANRENLKQWARQQYKWGSPFSPLDREPRLFVIDAFAVYKKKTEQEKER